MKKSLLNLIDNTIRSLFSPFHRNTNRRWLSRILTGAAFSTSLAVAMFLPGETTQSLQAQTTTDITVKGGDGGRGGDSDQAGSSGQNGSVSGVSGTFGNGGDGGDTTQGGNGGDGSAGTPGTAATGGDGGAGGGPNGGSGGDENDPNDYGGGGATVDGAGGGGGGGGGSTINNNGGGGGGGGAYASITTGSYDKISVIGGNGGIGNNTGIGAGGGGGGAALKFSGSLMASGMVLVQGGDQSDSSGGDAWLGSNDNAAVLTTQAGLSILSGYNANSGSATLDVSSGTVNNTGTLTIRSGHSVYATHSAGDATLIAYNLTNDGAIIMEAQGRSGGSNDSKATLNVTGTLQTDSLTATRSGNALGNIQVDIGTLSVDGTTTLKNNLTAADANNFFKIGSVSFDGTDNRLELDGGVYDIASTLMIDSGNTLVVSGQSTLNGTLTLTNGSKTEFDLNRIVSGTPFLTVTGTQTVNNGAIIEIYGGSTLTEGTYQIVADGNYSNATVTYNQINARYGEASVTQKNNGIMLEATTAADIARTATWTNGASTGNWNETDDNWSLDGNPSLHVFKNDDSVIFNGTDATPGTVTLTSDITVNEMTVSGGEYTFTADTSEKLNGTSLAINGGTSTFEMNATFTDTVYMEGGDAVVDGASASLKGAGWFVIGDQTTGSLTLKNGATAGSTNWGVILGNQSGGDGTVVLGSGTTLESAGVFLVGQNGGKGFLAGTGTAKGSSIDVASTGTLSPGDTDGAIGTLNISGDLALAGGATLKLDTADSSNDKIAATGAVTVESGVNLNVSASKSGTFEILTSGSEISGTNLSSAVITGTVDDYDLAVRGGTNSLQLKSTDNKVVELTLGALQNTTLTWTDETANGVWSTAKTNLNWSNNPGGTATEKRFMGGDNVVFNDTATNKNVIVDSNGVEVGTMTVLTSGYAFNLTVDAASPNDAAIKATTGFDLDDGTTLVVGLENADQLEKGESNAKRVIVLSGDGADEFGGTALLDSSLSRVSFQIDTSEVDELAYLLWLISYSENYGTRLSVNGNRMAGLIDGLPGGNGFLTALDSLGDDASVLSGIENSTGEAYAATILGTVNLQQVFNDSLLVRKTYNFPKRKHAVRGQCGSGLDNRSDFELWGTFTGGLHDRGSIGRYSGYDLSNYGVAVGVERNFGSRWFGGVAFGYDNAHLKLDDRFAKDDFDAVRASLYGGYTARDWYLSGYAGYSKNWHDVRRNNPVLGFSNRGKYNDDVYSGGLELGRTFRSCNGFRFTPSVGVHWVHLENPGFNESGSAASALRISKSSYDSVRIPIGVRLDKTFKYGSIAWTPELRAFYVSELGDTGSGLNTAFVASPGTGSVYADSGKSGRNGGMFGAGLNAQITNCLSVGIGYDYEVWENYDRHNLSGNVTLRW